MKQSLFILLASILSVPLFLSAVPSALYNNPDANIENPKKMTFEQNQGLISTEKALIKHTKYCLYISEQKIGKLSSEILNVPGLSSAKVRYLLNTLCTMPHTKYLEIGCGQGATLLSALFHNKNSIDFAIGIDNWSHVCSDSVEFRKNCNAFISDMPYKFYSHDCFSINPKAYIHQPINIYFYDGQQSEEGLFNAFAFFNEVLDDHFIAIVDDWNWHDIRSGTFAAFTQLGYQVIYEASLPANFIGDTANWWNGVYVAVIRKPIPIEESPSDDGSSD